MFQQKLTIENLAELPDEMLLKIVKNLHWRQLLELGTLSKRFRPLSNDNALWRAHFAHYFPQEPIPQGVSAKEAFKAQYIVIRHALNANNYSPQPAFRNSIFYALGCVARRWDLLDHFSDEIKSNLEVVLEAVRQDGAALRFASAECQNNATIVLEAMRQNWRALQFASAECKNNATIVLEAVRQNGAALQFASAELQNNATIVLEAVRKNGEILYWASAECKNNATIVLEALRQNWVAFQFASAECKNNATIVLEAVHQRGEALELASAECQNNATIVLEAVRQNWEALLFASAECQNNATIVLEAVRQNGKALRFASAECQINLELQSIASIRDFQERNRACNEYLTSLGLSPFGFFNSGSSEGLADLPSSEQISGASPAM